ncbi:MAG: phosphoribosylaminoimidazolesuccinocarboxamide synthase [Dehalococcoidia bacterium]|nr:phosphoribosylaminoimidazolesuccinocarboxamide synthase [Dehalococcoidia bacterium]
MLITETTLPLPALHKGKVRDTYVLEDKLLMVTTDRVSAFDVVLPAGIPYKGKVLNRLSVFWFKKTENLLPNHLIRPVEDAAGLTELGLKGGEAGDFSYLAGRAMVVKKARRIPVECVARGYLSGSAWAEYRQNGTIGGLPAPGGMQESQRLDIPLFTPTTKEDSGHDLPLSAEGLADLVGKEMAEVLKKRTLEIYEFARQYASSRGIIIADTKMEFGEVDGKLILIDELLTPDSSRFWPEKSYAVGRAQPSFDKQHLRDWLDASGWNKEPPAPALPPEVVKQTSDKYREAYRLLTGTTLK